MMQKLDEQIRRRLEDALRKGPLNRAELLTTGLTDPDLRRLVRHGELQHLFGHYAAGWSDPHFAAVVTAHRAFDGSVMSHFTAARLHQLRTWIDTDRKPAPPVDDVWITRAARTSRNEKRPGVVLRQAGLVADDSLLLNRVRVTSAARTAVDLARELPLREAIVTLDQVLAAHATAPEIDAVLARQAGWPGVRSARRAIALADPRSESALESIARVEFAKAGLPPPVLQASFWDGTRWTDERVDFWWPQFCTFAEADGLAKYEAGSAQQRRRQLRRAFLREQRLADLGLEMVRFGWEDAVVEPGDLVGRMYGAFARGARRGTSIRWRTLDLDLFPLAPEIELDAG